jgi:hypothetical protein
MSNRVETGSASLHIGLCLFLCCPPPVSGLIFCLVLIDEILQLADFLLSQVLAP